MTEATTGLEQDHFERAKALAPEERTREIQRVRDLINQGGSFKEEDLRFALACLQLNKFRTLSDKKTKAAPVPKKSLDDIMHLF